MANHGFHVPDLMAGHDAEDYASGQGWNCQRTMNSETVVDRCCGSVRLRSNPNSPGDMLGLVRLRSVFYEQ